MVNDGRSSQSYVIYSRGLAIPNIRVFGPSKAAAALEGSKTYAKDFMARYNIPTARYGNFSDYASAKKYLQQIQHPVVLKASGLAAGKGVLLPESKDEAQIGLRSIMLDKEFGNAGAEVVIEEYVIASRLQQPSSAAPRASESAIPCIKVAKCS